jgi:membrane-associated protease RseP (regulator of RpoE activity)
MQRKLIIAALAALLLPVMPDIAKAQSTGKSESQETIVLKQENDRTVIEIRNGNVYVNGDKMASVEDSRTGNRRKRIIIENGAGGRLGESMDHGSVVTAGKRAMLGVLTDPRDDKGGALITEVTPNSPAAEARLKAGDRILKVNGRSIGNAAALSEEISSNYQPGDEIVVRYERSGSTRTVNATLTEAPVWGRQNGRSFGFGNEEFNRSMPRNMYREFRFPDMNELEDAADQPRLGVSVEDRANDNGVTVIRVAPSSAAAAAGLREGDILTRINGEAVQSATALQQLVRETRRGEKLRITYERDGSQRTTEATIQRPQRRRDL